VPVAVNCWVVPGAIEALPGVIAIDDKEGATVRLNVPVTEPTFAWTEHDPAAFAASSPPAATVATLLFDVLQVADEVRSLEVPLL
jgi:hypothetical protein